LILDFATAFLCIQIRASRLLNMMDADEGKHNAVASPARVGLARRILASEKPPKPPSMHKRRKLRRESARKERPKWLVTGDACDWVEYKKTHKAYLEANDEFPLLPRALQLEHLQCL
jgi:hypothetical protein